MKFAEALRLADETGLPDLRGSYINPDISEWSNEKPPCCAIGGAAIVSRTFVFELDEGGVLTDDSRMSATDAQNCEDWSSILGGWVKCPVEHEDLHQDRIKRTIKNTIIHLYDSHLWSRSKIADWLDRKL